MAYTSFVDLKAIWTAIKTALENIRDTSGIKKITDPVDVSDRAGRTLGLVTASLSDSFILTKDPRGLVLISTPTLLTIPTYDGSGQAVHPSAVYIPDGFGGYKYWMAFTPYPNSQAAYENPSIVASNDGINWVVPAGVTNPIFPPPAESNYSDPHLEYDYQNNQLVLYWQWNKDGTSFRSTSSDGVTWSTPVTITPSIGTSPSVVKVRNNKWIAFAPDVQGRIHRTASADGITWDGLQWLEGVSWPSGSIGHSWFGVDDVGYHALLCVAPSNRAWANCNLYYAFSRNSYDWHIFPTPILGRNVEGIGLRSIYRASMVNIGDRWRLYFSAWNADGTWRLGYVDCRLALGDIEDYYKQCVITLFRKLQIRDTSIQSVPDIYNTEQVIGIQDWNKYRYKAIIYSNSHDQPLTMRFITAFRGELNLATQTDWLYKADGSVPWTYTLPAKTDNTPSLITASDLALLSGLTPARLSIQVNASTAPTTGQLSMKLIMWN